MSSTTNFNFILFIQVDSQMIVFCNKELTFNEQYIHSRTSNKWKGKLYFSLIVCRKNETNKIIIMRINW